jgi:hypothetical protein
MIERRQAERHKTYKGAQILCGAGPPIIGCVVRNLSRTGACIEVDMVIRTSRLFNLMLDSDGSMRACQVVWRTEQRMGVQFI